MDSSPRSQRHFILQLGADPHFWVLAFAPLYILFVSSNWIFSAPNSIDPWVYHGFFRNLQEYKTVLFPETYYGSRLSWLLPGYIFYGALPSLAANYGLHLSFLYAAVFALYYTLKTAFSRRTALITSVFLASYSFFLRPMGSDYVDGPANAYFFVCLAFLTAAGRSEHDRFPLFLAGIFCAAVVYTNLFTVIFAPVVLLYFAVLSHRSRRPRTIQSGISSLAWFLAGSAALTVLLACANFLIEGKFLFYLPSIYYALGSVGQPNPWKSPVAEWAGRAEWLLLPMVVAAAGLAALSRRWFRDSVAGPAAVGAFLLACLFMVFCEWRGIPVLQYSYYASYLVPPAFLVIGALLEEPLQRLRNSFVVPLALGVLLVNTIPLWGSNAYLNQLKSGTWPAAPVLCGMAFAVCAALHFRAAPWVMVAAVVACHVATVSTGYSVAERHATRDSFVRVAQAAEAVDAVRNGERALFWYSNTDPHFPEFNALNAVYLWGYTMISNEFPALLPNVAVSPGSLLVIPSSGSDILDRANESLRSESLTAELVEQREVAAGGVGFSLWFVRVGFDFARLKPQSLQPCEPAPCDILLSEADSALLPLDGWVKCEYPGLQSSVEPRPDGLHVTTVPARFGYSAKYGPLVADDAGRYIFRLRYGLESGGIAFGAMSGDESRWLAHAAGFVSQPGERTAVLSVEAEAGEPFWLMISNNHPADDRSSAYVIRELEAYLFPVTEAAMQTHSAEQ